MSPTRWSCVAKAQPTLQRLRRLTRTSPSEQPFDADVLVQFRPMNADTTANELPATSFAITAARQAWIPRRRHGEGAPVGQFNVKHSICNVDLQGACTLRFSHRNSHSSS